MFLFSENIFGYRNLRVDMFMTASSLKAFVRMSADETISKAKSGGVDPDPVLPPLLELLAPEQVRLLSFFHCNMRFREKC